MAQGSSSDTNCLTMSLVECSSYCLERERRGGEEEEGESAGDVTPFITHLISIVSYMVHVHIHTYMPKHDLQ